MVKRECKTGAKLPGIAGLIALSWIVPATLNATPSVGFTSQTFRAPIPANVYVSQWDPGPLFTLLIQSATSSEWGIDVVPGTTQFAPMDGMGRPSQSGWHDHPTLLTIGVVVQGTIWEQKPDLNCLVMRRAGSVFFERGGEIHNVFNLDPQAAAEVRVMHFIGRGETSTRRDQPDPVTGSASVAGPPPPVCPAGTTEGAASNRRVMALPMLFNTPFSETDSPERRAIRRDRQGLLSIGR